VQAPAAIDAAIDAAIPSERELSRLFADFSESTGDFLSDNTVSNESSYLQIASELRARARPGGAYIGVGPEQNFTYIALARPAIAFIVDIRRGNALLHFFYKALFEIADSRAEFLALLFGRERFEAENEAKIEDLLHKVANAKHSERRGIRERIPISLSASDERELDRIERSFSDKGLEVAFEMKGGNAYRYPTIRELFEQKSPEGEALGFLASEEEFRFVQRMEREDRIVPVVGDFAGDHALAAIGKELTRRNLSVSVFYASNVEQYLFPKWREWTKNIHSLPLGEQSLIIRVYLNQGQKHPKELPGHRTTTLLQSFKTLENSPKTYLELTLRPDK